MRIKDAQVVHADRRNTFSPHLLTSYSPQRCQVDEKQAKAAYACEHKEKRRPTRVLPIFVLLLVMADLKNIHKDMGPRCQHLLNAGKSPVVVDVVVAHKAQGC